LLEKASSPMVFKLVKVDKFNSPVIALKPKADDPMLLILLVVGHIIDDI
jgi:hypothetical protein